MNISSTGYTGLAFPMRLSNKGGLKLTTTSPTDFTHIEESIRQIVGTAIGERPMELYFGSNVSYHIFDPTDDSAYNLLRHEIVEALEKFEPRIQVESNDIKMQDSLDDLTGENLLHITITYRVISYNKTGTVDVQIGGNN